ncbi:MAG: hypothetical protein EON91_00145 [Brevundimonas sp.]|nr:MAG: hypothetical protein EON91_00145 [Brevundimonas sp.]
MFRERSRHDLIILRKALMTRPPADPELERTVHGLAGSAGIFGHADIGAAALALDADFAAGRPPDEHRLQALVALLEALPGMTG